MKSEKVVTVYVTQEEKEEITRLAKKNHSSISTFIKQKIFSDSERERVNGKTKRKDKKSE